MGMPERARPSRARKTPAVPPLYQSPVAPVVFWASLTQASPYQLPPLERAETLYHTVKAGVVTSVRCRWLEGIRRGVEHSLRPDQVWPLRDEATWKDAQTLYQAYQRELTVLEACVEHLGTYALRLREAGGIGVAPNPLAPMVISLPIPGEQRVYWRWRFPQKPVRLVVERHTVKMLAVHTPDVADGAAAAAGSAAESVAGSEEAAVRDLRGGFVAQHTHVVCPTDEAWQEVWRSYTAVKAAEIAWLAFLDVTPTYAMQAIQAMQATMEAATKTDGC